MGNFSFMEVALVSLLSAAVMLAPLVAIGWALWSWRRSRREIAALRQRVESLEAERRPR